MSLGSPPTPTVPSPPADAGAHWLPGASRSNPHDPKSPGYIPPAGPPPPLTYTAPSAAGAMPTYGDPTASAGLRNAYLNQMRPNYNFNISGETNKPTDFTASKGGFK